MNTLSPASYRLQAVVLELIKDSISHTGTDYQYDLIRHTLIDELTYGVHNVDSFTPMALFLQWACSFSPILSTCLISQKTICKVNYNAPCGFDCDYFERGKCYITFKCKRCRQRLHAGMIMFLQGIYAPLPEDYRLAETDPTLYLRKYYTEVNTATLAYLEIYLLLLHDVDLSTAQKVMKMDSVNLAYGMITTKLLSINANKEKFLAWFNKELPGISLINFKGDVFYT